MTAVLLSVHVVAAVVLIGPITAAASLFPRYAREALAASASAPESDTESDSGSDSGSDVGSVVGATAVPRALHRISAGYAVLAVAVPVFGVATAAQMGVLSEAWLWVSMALTALAAALLVVVVVPEQRRVLAALSPDAPALDPAGRLQRLSMCTGLFALTWVVVTVLMIVRPGSSTGAGL